MKFHLHILNPCNSWNVLTKYPQYQRHLPMFLNIPNHDHEWQATAKKVKLEFPKTKHSGSPGDACTRAARLRGTCRDTARVHFSTFLGTARDYTRKATAPESLTGGLPADLSDFLAQLTCNFHGNFQRLHLPTPFTPIAVLFSASAGSLRNSRRTA